MKKLIMLIVLIAMVQSSDAIGIGIAPSSMAIDNALKGAEYEKSMTIFNTGEDGLNFSLSASGDIGEWISFYNLDNQKITTVYITAKDKISVIVKFNIPEDAVSTNYTGLLNIKSIPGNLSGSGSQQSVIIGSYSNVAINVTGDQILDGVVKAIMIEDVEPGHPLIIKIMFQNTGNVIAKPKILAIIKKDVTVIANIMYEGTKIKPATTDTIITQWNTTNENALGNYTANIEISLNNKILKSDNLSFKIVPTGTFTRQGNLTNISIIGNPTINTPIKVAAYFKNTGQIETQAKFSGEVYNNNNLIDAISSDELTIEKNKEIVLISYLKPASAGDYLVKGKVIYSGKETEVKEASFKVTDMKSTPGFEGFFTAIIIITLILLRIKNRSE